METGTSRIRSYNQLGHICRCLTIAGFGIDSTCRPRAVTVYITRTYLRGVGATAASLDVHIPLTETRTPRIVDDFRSPIVRNYEAFGA